MESRETVKYTKSNIIQQQNQLVDKQQKLKRIQEEAGETSKQAKKSPWINAWSDNVVGIHSISQMMQLADLSMDGDYVLVIGSIFDIKKEVKLKQQKCKIKVYKGINMVHEFVVDDKPVAMVTVFDTLATPHLPMVAVAVGSSIVYFKDFSPHLKFDLPMIEFSSQESEIWRELMVLTSKQFNHQEEATESSQDNDLQALPNLLEKLFSLREELDEGLSYMSTRLLALESQQEQFAFIDANMNFLKGFGIQNGAKFVHRNFITCMHKIPKDVDDEKSQQIILVGTESSQLLILDKSGMSINETVYLDSIPVFMASTGTMVLDLKIYIACRNGYVYLYKSGKISSSFNVRIESKPLGLLKLDKTVVLAGMNKNLYSFYNKGRLNFIKTMPAEITDI